MSTANATPSQVSATPADPRIAELHALAAEAGRPLAFSAEDIVALEDEGQIVDPFTGDNWPNPDVEEVPDLWPDTPAAFTAAVTAPEAELEPDPVDVAVDAVEALLNGPGLSETELEAARLAIGVAQVHALRQIAGGLSHYLLHLARQ